MNSIVHLRYCTLTTSISQTHHPPQQKLPAEVSSSSSFACLLSCLSLSLTDLLWQKMEAKQEGHMPWDFFTVRKSSQLHGEETQRDGSQPEPSSSARPADRLEMWAKQPSGIFRRYHMEKKGELCRQSELRLKMWFQESYPAFMVIQDTPAQPPAIISKWMDGWTDR